MPKQFSGNEWSFEHMMVRLLDFHLQKYEIGALHHTMLKKLELKIIKLSPRWGKHRCKSSWPYIRQVSDILHQNTGNQRQK